MSLFHVRCRTWTSNSIAFLASNCFSTDLEEYIPIQNATQRAGELDRLNERVGPLHGMTLAIKDNIAVTGT